MTVTQENPPNPPAGDPPGGGAAGGDGGKGGEGDKKPETVPYDTHRRLLDDHKKNKAKLDQIEAERAEAARAEAEKKGEYQKLLEQERAEKLTLKQKLDAQDLQEKGRRKLAAILNNAGGNIDRKWYPTIEAAGLIDQVIIDPDTGEVDSVSVTKAVEKLKQGYPEIVVPRGGPKTPNGDPKSGGSANPGTIRRSEWKKLPSIEMKKWKGRVIDD